MKDFITGIVIITILLIFPVQYVLDQINDTRIKNLELVVNNSKEIAKQDGYFTPSNIANLKSQIADTFDINESEITISATTTPKFRRNEYDEREQIKYKISVPIKKIIVAASFFKIDENNNKGYYIIDRSTTSERIEK